MRIGVLALQGAFIEHIHALEKLKTDCCEIRQVKDFRNLDGLIIPGGESTVMAKLLKELNLFDTINGAINEGLPVFGTCAGLILLAKRVEGKCQLSFNAMDITAMRNAYGRQLGSFSVLSEFKGIGNIKMVFIRAPYILDAGESVDILASVDGKIVAARQDNILVTAFHPELTEDRSVHKYFLTKICKGNN